MTGVIWQLACPLASEVERRTTTATSLTWTTAKIEMPLRLTPPTNRNLSHVPPVYSMHPNACVVELTPGPDGAPVLNSLSEIELSRPQPEGYSSNDIRTTNTFTSPLPRRSNLLAQG